MQKDVVILKRKVSEPAMPVTLQGKVVQMMDAVLSSLLGNPPTVSTSSQIDLTLCVFVYF